MLYTSYFKNMNKLLINTIKIVVSLFPPKEINIDNVKVFYAPNLAPDSEDFRNYKNDIISFERYIEMYTYKLKTNIMSVKMIDNIALALQSGKDIALICYEKDYLQCHRYYLAKYISDKYNIEWKEF